MGRTSNAREQLIEATHTLMRRRGYGAIGVAQICAVAEVRKGSFYHFFASKEALTVAALREAWAAERRSWRALVDSTIPAVDRLEALVGSQVSAQCEAKKGSGSVVGCLYGNLALEIGPDDDPVRACLAEIFEDQVAIIHDVLKAGVADGSINDARAGRETARALLAQLEGMVMFAKLHDDPAILKGVWTQVLVLLGDPQPC